MRKLQQNMNLIINESKDNISWSEINMLTEKVGWGKNYYSSEDHWHYTLQKSTYVAYLKSPEGVLIAFGRILEDGQMCMFYDVCVHPDYQKNALGSLIMNHLIDKIKDKNYISIGLFAWDGNQSVPEFYSKLGFKESRGMELKKFMRNG